MCKSFAHILCGTNSPVLYSCVDAASVLTQRDINNGRIDVMAASQNNDTESVTRDDSNA